MAVIECQNEKGSITKTQVSSAVEQFSARHDCTGKRILFIIPDNTRSGPIGDIFKMIYDCVGKKVKALDCLVALGTH